MQVITSKQETFTKVFAKFTETGVVFGNLQGNPTSLSSKFPKILTKESIQVEEVHTTFFHGDNKNRPPLKDADQDEK